MTTKWSQPTEKTVRIPSLQTLVFAVLLVIALGIVTWVIVAENTTQGRAFPPPGPDSSNAADWVSAIGTVVGALLTAGALLIAAFSYRRQVADKHRAQAAAITVGVRTEREYMDTGELRTWYQYFVRNDSLLPIYHVRLYFGPVEKRRNNDRQVIAPSDEVTFDSSNSDFTAFAKFVDSSGVAWKRDGSGKLIEIKNNDGQPWPMD